MIDIIGLHSGYESRDVLQDISLHIGKGDFTVILGPNGAGKSTLLYTLTTHLPIRRGEINLLGKPLGTWTRKELASIIAFIPQESVLPYDYTVQDIVLMGRYPYLGMWQNWAKHDYDVTADMLALLGLQGFAERYYSKLSGGEKQRVLLARALAQETEIILLDEALSQLDINHQIEMMQLLHKINREQNKTILLISHQLNLAANAASHLIMLKEGRLKAHGSVESVLTPAMLQEVFDISLRIDINPLSGKPNVLYPGIG